MLDIRHIRENDADVRAGLARRGGDFGAELDELAELDARRREAVTEVNGLKARRNEVSREIGERKQRGEDADDMIAAMREVGSRISALDARVAEAEARTRELLLAIPNLPLEGVPPGGEENNEIRSTWGEPREFDFEPRPHWELGERLGILDLPRGAKVAGSGFPVLRGAGARLQRGLIDWFLDAHVERGYEELRVPYVVNDETLTGTGQLPKFADESYQVERDDLWLIPTAEVPVTNLHGDELLAPDTLPLRYTAYSPCFRREAGAAGKDTRGLLRVHQFDKVELVRYETPERGPEALEEMTAEAEALLRALELPHRRVLLSAGDMSFAAAMTYDLEVWAPGVERWLEVSSVSLCTDYQARRANLRFRREAGARPDFVHTLNGSALALPRVVAAILETYQEEDGSVGVPGAIRDRVGLDRIEAG